MSRFTCGDLVVLPGAGLGEVEAIETLDLPDLDESMYRIRVRDSEVRMWVPVGRETSERLRKPMPNAAVRRVLRLVVDTTAPEKRATWNRRQRRYTEQLMSNDPEQLGALVGELASVRENKPLSFSERGMMERAYGLLKAELEASAKDPERAVARLEAAVS